MAYGVKYRCTHKELSGDSGETTFIIEILEDGFTGTVTEVTGLGDVFRLNYDKVDPRNPTESPVQKGRMEFYLAVEGASELAILEEFLAADEDQYQMRLKQDGNIRWTGYILTDLLEYSEGDYPFRGKIVAKDLTRLAGVDFPLTDDRVTLITTLADFLDDVGLGLDIYTYTNWITNNTTNSDDFLNQIYNERRAFREFGRTGDEDPQPITILECLERFLRNYGLILRQENNAWRVYQLTALSDPLNVDEFVYDSTGTKTATNLDQDLTISIDKVNRYLLPPSTNEINPGIKRAKVKFDHRNRISGILFPEEVEITDSGSEIFSEPFISDGNQTLNITGLVRAVMRTGAADAKADLSIVIERTGLPNYYLDEDGDNWITSGTGFAPLELIDMGGDIWQRNFDILTPELPADADGVLRITLSNAYASNTMPQAAQTTFWRDVALEIRNINSSVSVDYQLTQTGGYSTNFDLAPTWFGDGPNSFAVSALRYGTGDNEITETDWQFRGTTTGYRKMHENLLKEIIDTQRSARRNIQAQLWGDYNSTQIVSHDSKYFFFLGGDLTGRNYWNAQILEINIAIGTDTFEEILKYSEGDESGGTTTSSTSTGGGVTVTEGDNRWLNESANLSDLDSPSTAITNLGVTATAAELNRLDGTLSTVQANLGLRDGSADLDLNSLTINGAEEGPVLSNSRTNAPRALTIQPTGGNNVGSAEVYPHGTDDRSHFVVANSSDFDNNGAVKWELDGTQASMWAYTKGTGGVMPTNFIFRDFADGVWFEQDARFHEDVMIGINQDPSAPLDIHHGADDFTGIRLGNTIDASFDTGIYLRTLGIGKIRTGTTGELHLEGGNAVKVFNGSSYGDAEINMPGSVQIGRYLDSATDNTPEIASIQNLDDSTYTARFFGDQRTEFFGDTETDNFSSGWAGTGWQGSYRADWEMQNLRVRGALRVYEFIAKQLSSIGGTEILSIANAKIQSIDTVNNIITVDNVSGTARTPFKQNDLWIVQVVDINNDLESGGTGSIVYRVRGTVTDTAATDGTLNGDQIRVSVDAGSLDGLSALEEQDLIVAYGNTTDTNRQAIMYRNVDRSEDNLIMRVQTDITQFSDLQDPLNTKVAFGDINGYGPFTSETFGFYAQDNFYLDLDSGAMNIGKDAGGAGVDGIHLGANDYWYTDKTGSVGGGILNWTGSQVDIAGFTADSTDLYSNAGAGQVRLWGQSSLLGMRIVPDTNDLGDRIDILFNDSTGAWGIRGVKNGSDLFRLGDTNRIAGSYFDATDLWGGSATKDNAALRFDFANNTITVASGGEITNSGSDYSITDSGFNVTENSSFLSRNAYTIGADRGAFWGDGTDIILESRDLTGGDLNIRSLGGVINLNTAGSATDTNLYGYNYFERFQQQADETRTLLSSGEDSLTIDAPIVRLTSINSGAILARFDIGTSPNTDRSFSFMLVNDSGTNLTIRDQSNSSLTGDNIKTSAGVDRLLQDGGSLPVTYISSTGNYHIGQDRT